MNILTITPHGLYQDYSSSFVHNQAKAYVQLGHRVRAVIPLAVAKKNDAGKRFGKTVEVRHVDGVEIFYVRYLSLGRFGAGRFNRKSAELTIRWLMQRILCGFQPDVIHGHTLDLGSELGAYFKKAQNCPLVVTTHGGDTNVALAKGNHAQLKAYCDQVDAVVAVSGKLKKGLESCNIHTPVHVIHNGFAVYPEPAVCERNMRAIIQVGNLIPSKRVDVTIHALAKLRQTWSNMTLTVIGQGPLRGELEQLCQELGVADAVCFLGQRPNREVFQKMCESGYFIMASKPEGFGIVYLEAMAAGCVVTGTEDEGIADLIENEKNGFLVPADDVDAVVNVLRDCLNDPEKTRQIAAAGRETALELTWEHNAGLCTELFEKLVKGA